MLTWPLWKPAGIGIFIKGRLDRSHAGQLSPGDHLQQLQFCQGDTPFYVQSDVDQRDSTEAGTVCSDRTRGWETQTFSKEDIKKENLQFCVTMNAYVDPDEPL